VDIGKSRAIVMIIQCPNCRFSGRIPGYAVDSPHNARCPRCRFRFDLQALLADSVLGMVAESGPEPGPGSSSYELKAITEENGHAPPAADTHDPWQGDEEPDPFDDAGLIDPARGAYPTATRPVKTSVPALADSKSSEVRAAEPWYSRVLQVWGIVFLIWAAMIVARSLFPQFVPVNGAPGGSDVVSSAVSVLLLVPGAAALFLLVDLGRYIRGLRPPDPRTASETASPVRAVSMRPRPWRSWSRPFHAAPSARS